VIKAYKYKYNNKELQDELDLNWYDYSARNYDTALGRFMNLDPLAEKYNFQSPYVYADNNPVFFVDINGMGVDEQDWKREIGKNGIITYTAEKGDSAWSLYVQYGKIDKFTTQEANNSVEIQLGKNYKDKKGKIKSNVEIGNTVEIIPEYVAEINTESFINYPKNHKINLKKIDDVGNKIERHYKEIDNYNNLIRDEMKNGSQEGPHNIGFLVAMEMHIYSTYKKIDKENHFKDSLKRISKPDTFKYNVIRIHKNNIIKPTMEIKKDEFKK